MTERMKSETIAVHGGRLPAVNTQTRLERLMNLLSELEGGSSSMLVYSGMAAIHQVVITLARTGDEIVSSGNIRPETNNLFNVLLRDMGITVNFVYTTSPSAFDGAISPKTRFIFLELEGSVIPEVYDIAAIASTAHKNKIPLIVDASGIPPLLYRPINDGADIVIRDFSSVFGAYSAISAGSVTDAGRFDWRASNVPLMKAADPIMGNIRWAFDLPKDFSKDAFALRFRLVVQRTLWSEISEETAGVILDAIQTYSLRFERQCENALAVAKMMAKNKKIAWVRYPGLPEDAANKVASKQFGKLFGMSFVFGFSGHAEDVNVVADRFLNALRLVQTGVDPCGSCSTARSYAKTTLRSSLSVKPAMPPILEQYPGLIRFTAGAENSKDLLADINQALKTV